MAAPLEHASCACECEREVITSRDSHNFVPLERDEARACGALTCRANAELALCAATPREQRTARRARDEMFAPECHAHHMHALRACSGCNEAADGPRQTRAARTAQEQLARAREERRAVLRRDARGHSTAAVRLARESGYGRREHLHDCATLSERTSIACAPRPRAPVCRHRGRVCARECECHAVRSRERSHAPHVLALLRHAVAQLVRGPVAPAVHLPWLLRCDVPVHCVTVLLFPAQ